MTFLERAKDLVSKMTISWKKASTCVDISGKSALYFKYEGEGAIDIIEIFFE